MTRTIVEEGYDAPEQSNYKNRLGWLSQGSSQQPGQERYIERPHAQDKSPVSGGAKNPRKRTSPGVGGGTGNTGGTSNPRANKRAKTAPPSTPPSTTVNKPASPQSPSNEKKKPPVPPEGHLPTPFNPTAELHDTLLPWLALGFSPIPTPGTSKTNYCGIHAIQKSYTAAIDALNVPCNTPLNKIGFKAFQSLLASAEYTNIAKEQLNAIYQGWESGEDWQQDQFALMLDEQTKKSYLSIDQISRLLQVANKKYGTEFDLAYITQGYRCKLNPKTYIWDTAYSVDTTGNRMGNSKDINRPVIFVWSDGGSERWDAWGQGVGGGHFESFGPPGKKENLDRDAHRRRVANWKLGKMLKQDINKGVWRVTENRGPGQGQLEVKIGHFVREVTPPKDLVIPKGHKYMTLCRTSSLIQVAGLIPTSKLVKIELHSKAPAEAQDDPGFEDPLEKYTAEFVSHTGQTKEVAKILLEKHGDVSAAVAAYYRSISPSSPKPNPSKPSPPSVKPQKDFIPGQITFKICRGIDATNKLGEPIDLATIDGFQIDSGEFLLERPFGTFHAPMVTDINGAQGAAHIRVLQRLQRPWGLRDDLVLPIFHDPNPKPLKDMSLPELRDRVKATGGNATKSKRTMIKDITRWEEDNIISLPLYIVHQDYTAAEAQSTTDFSKGEIVRVTSLASNKGKLLVCDFEGLNGMIAVDHLIELDAAFGLRLRKNDVDASIDLSFSAKNK